MKQSKDRTRSTSPTPDSVPTAPLPAAATAVLKRLERAFATNHRVEKAVTV